MAATAPRRNASRTRDLLLDAAVRLYGSRGIDAVSLREIGAAAGQKNPNALQYHFRDRDGLLQAIVDRHSSEIGRLREDYFARADAGEWGAAEAAARCLVMPIFDYVGANPTAADFVKVVSQIHARNQGGPDSVAAVNVRFPKIPPLRALLDQALAHLPDREARRRVFLVVNTAFHAIADIHRAAETGSRIPETALGPMAEQLIRMLSVFLEAAPIEAGA